jgi:hypothetical protein
MPSQYTQQWLLPLRGRDLLEDMDVIVRLGSPYDAVLLAGSVAALRMSWSQLASS